VLLGNYLSFFVRKVPPHRHKVEKLKALFAEVNDRTRSFQKKTGLTCPERCGACCQSPHIETTELEMLPLADELIHNGKANEWYALAEGQDFLGQCVFYVSSPSDQMNGCCQAYALRPLICRLFAFAGNRDKHGHVRLVTCKVIKKVMPVLAEKALSDVVAGKVVPPVMADLIMRASTLDPEMSRESLPINTAFKRAVERLWLYERLISQEG
jgi:Fe-S-cluster containining protein